MILTWIYFNCVQNNQEEGWPWHVKVIGLDKFPFKIIDILLNKELQLFNLNSKEVCLICFCFFLKKGTEITWAHLETS